MLLRKCVATKTIKPVEELFRVVRLKDNSVVIEKETKVFGRGAYVSKDLSAIKIAHDKKLLSKALRCEVKEDIYLELIKML